MMIHLHVIIQLFLLYFACTGHPDKTKIKSQANSTPLILTTVRDIPLPEGFFPSKKGDSVFTNWLLQQKLKRNNTVHLYNGQVKSNQQNHYAVVDMDIGKKDLVQCADAVMKIRGDYLFSMGLYNEIKFLSTSGETLSFVNWLKGMRWKLQGSRLVSFYARNETNKTEKEYNAFMDFVFSYCGSYSLSKQLETIWDISTMQPGDVIVEGGFPGHAVTVMAVAENKIGKNIFLLSQGYMPAQDIHILKNYSRPVLNPWYSAEDIFPLITPEWKFEKGSLKRWN
jgi:hypothetical protein